MIEKSDIDRVEEHLRKNGDTIVVTRTTLGLTKLENLWEAAMKDRGLDPKMDLNIWSGISTGGMMVFKTKLGKLLVAWIMSDIDDIMKIDRATDDDIREAVDSLEIIGSDELKKFAREI